MILKVNFNDNDFRTEVQEACEKFMQEVCNGDIGKKAIENYKKLRSYSSLDDIKVALVKATYGLYIANQVLRLYIDIDPTSTVEKYHYLNYFNRNFKITQVKSFVEEWSNSEIAYIDFENYKVTIV